MESIIDKTSTRYPYTYSCDLIRSTAGYNESGTKLSRSDASRIRQLFAKVLHMDDELLAKQLVDYYIEHEQDIDEQDIKNMNSNLKIGGQTINEWNATKI